MNCRRSMCPRNDRLTALDKPSIVGIGDKQKTGLDQRKCPSGGPISDLAPCPDKVR